MDQINHIGRNCDSELRFCGTAQRFWTQWPSSSLAGWLAIAREAFLSHAMGSLSRWQWQGRRRLSCCQSQACIHPETSDAIRVWKMWRRMKCMLWMEGGSVSARSGLDHTNEEVRPGLWLVHWCMVLDSGLGIQWQQRSWKVVECGNIFEVCLGMASVRKCVCELAFVCVYLCISWGSTYSGIQRCGKASIMQQHSRGQARAKYDLHCHKWRRTLSFQNKHTTNLSSCALCTITQHAHIYLLLLFQ